MRRDPELLRAFARESDQHAFRELVERHLPVVYGAAQRILGADPHAAQDVAQVAFSALARHARSLEGRDSVAGWLHTVARNTAVQQVRSEVRRRAREQHSEAMNLPETSPEPQWERLRPWIDEALGALPERDRTIVALRFFEGLSFAEVGQRLDVGADAARMRTDRALEKLRRALAKRGVASTATLLGGALATQGALALPAGLAAQVGTVALGSVAATVGVGPALSIFLMTTSQKTLVALAVLAAGGAAYQSWRLHERSAQLAVAERHCGALERELGETRVRLGSAQAELGATDRVLTEAEQLIAAVDLKQIAASENLSPELKAWMARCDKLRALAASLPEKTIPELALMKVDDWMLVARQLEFGTDVLDRKALLALRVYAKTKVVPLLRQALNAYLKEHDNTLPPDIASLRPYVSAPLTEAMLQRYRMVQSGRVDKTSASPWLVEADRRDDEYETEINLTRWSSGSREVSMARDAVQDAIRAYRTAHANQRPKDVFEVVPYLANPTDPRIVAHIERTTANGGTGLGDTVSMVQPMQLQYAPKK